MKLYRASKGDLITIIATRVLENLVSPILLVPEFI